MWSKPFWLGLLHDTRGGLGGSGDGSGDSDGTGSGDGAAGGVTEERVQELISKAIGARLREFEGKVAKTLDARIGDAVTKVTEVIDEKLRGAPPPPPPAGGTGPGPDQNLENHPIVKGLQKQVADLTAASEKSKAEVEAERAKARHAELRQDTLTILGTHGIDGQRAQHAIGYLLDAQKLVRHDSEGRAVYGPAGEDPVDLATGLKSWVGSEDGKFYLPPSGASGSGGPPRGGPPPAKKTADGVPTKQELGGALLSMIRR